MSFEQAIPSAITLVDRLIVYTKTQTTKGKVQSLAKLCDETLEQMKNPTSWRLGETTKNGLLLSTSWQRKFFPLIFSRLETVLYTMH